MFFYSSVLYRNTCNHFPNSLAFTSVMCVSFRIIMGRFKSERTAPVMRLKTGLVVWFEVRPFFTACVTHSQPDSNLANQSQFKATIVWLMKPPLPRLQFIVPGSRIVVVSFSVPFKLLQNKRVNSFRRNIFTKKIIINAILWVTQTSHLVGLDNKMLPCAFYDTFGWPWLLSVPGPIVQHTEHLPPLVVCVMQKCKRDLGLGWKCKSERALQIHSCRECSLRLW